MDYDIVIYGSPELRVPATRVERVDADIKALAEDMIRAMHRHRGLGLAAEQVGRKEALFVVDIPPEARPAEEHDPLLEPDLKMPLVLINPRITATRGEQTGQEGCLSFPDIFVQIKRAAEVDVTFTDLESREITLKARGLLARAVQHETDHLNGILLVDRMSPVQKVAMAGRLKRLRKKPAAV